MSPIKTLARGVGALAGLAAAGLVYQRIALARDRRKLRAPGLQVESGRRPLHVLVRGTGRPAVVLESGIAASSLSWSLVQPEVAKFTQVVSYDRAGLGWSPGECGAVTLAGLVEDLRAALTAASIPRPVVMAGHSFGGLIARAYAAWYPDEIAGLVLVDPALPAEWMEMDASARRRLALGVKLSRRGVWLARWGVVRLMLMLLRSGARALPQGVARLSGGSGSSVAARLVGEVQKLPPEVWPAIQAHWSDARCFATMAAYLEALPASARTVDALTQPERIPVTILSAANASAAQKSAWDTLAAGARNGRHVVARRSGHWIPFDEPELVVDAIRLMTTRTVSQ